MRKIYLSLVSLVFIFNANAQLSGTVNVPSGGIPSLTNIGGLFDQINTAGISGDLAVKVTADLSGETGTVALFATGIGIYKISIEPDMAALRTVSGSSAGAALIRFDGADRVTIDGRFSGSGNYIRIRNTENSAPALLLVNDAQNNSIRNTIIESGNAIENIQNTGGALQIGNSNVVNGFGNDNNIITYNEIRDRSDISGTSVIGILALGSTSATDIYNDNNVISNNNIHDFFSPASTVQAGVFIGVGNSRYNIDSNSIYQTASRTYTTTGAATRGISVVQPSATNNYGGYNIRNNYVGGTALGGGINGAYWMLGISGNIINSFVGIGTSTGTLPNLIANNVIKNIDLTTVSPAFNANQFVGISAISGVYDITNNQVGAPTGTDSIKITVNTSSGANITANVTGIGTFNTPSTGYTVTGNKVGGITMIHNTTGTIQAQLISVAGSPTTPVVINNNLIGSLTTPNSITISPSANRAFMIGMRSFISTGVPITFSNNIIQNLTDNSSHANTQDWGIYVSPSGAGAAVSPVITNNIIKEIKSNAGPTALSTTATHYGINVENFTGTAIEISGNTISGLRSINPGATNPFTAGISVRGVSSGGTISKNKISDITNTAAGSSPRIYGVYASTGNNWTVSNNMIGINNSSNSNDVSVRAIADASTGGNFKGFYNSVYVGGTGSGTQNSYGYLRTGTANTSWRNNLIAIDRINGTGFSYAIANNNGSPATGWPASASTYNTFITPAVSNVGEWNSAAQSFTSWKAVSAGDLESYADINATVSVSNLYTDAGNGDLTIKTGNTESWYANGKGIAGASINSIASDLTGDVRGTTEGTPTDIGADEFTPNGGVLPPDNVASAAPAFSTATTYTFGGRPIGEILWGALGTVPTAVTWKYYSGVPGISGGINSYQDVPETGGSGYVFDIKQYFTVAEQNQLPDASLQGIKKVGAAPWTNIGGTLGTDVAGKFVTSAGQTSFSLFSLAPASVIPVKLVSFTGNRSYGSNNLIWVTENEDGTKEFILERSTDGNRFSGITAKQARGFGNANYAYNDGVIFTGKMYYRLKIIDNNGRFVYSNIIILTEDKNLITSLYPNPVLDKATLQIKDNSLLQTTAVLFDINGREIGRVIIRNAFELIDFSGITPGTYLLRLANKEVVKIIKN